MLRRLRREVLRRGRRNNIQHRLIDCLRADFPAEQFIGQAHLDIRIQKVKRHSHVRNTRNQLTRRESISLHLQPIVNCRRFDLGLHQQIAIAFSRFALQEIKMELGLPVEK